MSVYIVNRLMFDYKNLTEEEIIEYTRSLDKKIIRWLGAHHPDNRLRKIFFLQTNVRIGNGTVLNQNLIISDNYETLVTIGSRVAISPNVTIIAASNPNNSTLKNNKYTQDHLIKSEKIIIEDDVWIGAGVVILPGVTIGKKSIIGAGAVITKDVPSCCIVAGNPARIIRSLTNTDLSE